MREACFCGRVGEIENREPFTSGNGDRALRCSGCGHLDHLRWLPDDVRLLVLGEPDEWCPGSVLCGG